MKKKVLVFNRPFTTGFTKLYKELGLADVYYVSDFKYMDDVGLMKRVYALLNDPLTENQIEFLDYEDILKRDRYIKHIDKSIACRLITSVWIAINQILDERRYDGFIGLCVDNYILQLTLIACLKRGIRSTAPIQSFLKGYVRMNNFGECYKLRTCSEAEVEAAYKTLTAEKFKPIWLKDIRDTKKLLKLFIKERFKKAIFETLKVVLNDPYSFHYNGIYPLPEVVTVKSYDNIKARSYFEQDLSLIQDKIKKSKKSVYFALQFVPETSINYYIRGNEFSDYVKVIKDMFENHIPKDTLVLVKEHPDIFGFSSGQLE